METPLSTRGIAPLASPDRALSPSTLLDEVATGPDGCVPSPHDLFGAGAIGRRCPTATGAPTRGSAMCNMRSHLHRQALRDRSRRGALLHSVLFLCQPKRSSNQKRSAAHLGSQ